MAEATNKTIILGAGLAGLSAAYYSGFDVYEARGTAGGSADSIRNEGFVFDFGIHVLHSKDPFFHNLIKILDVELISHKRKAWIYSYGCYSSYPFQVNTSHLPLALRIKCLFGYFLNRNHSVPKNYKEWMLQNFGAGFSELFLIPYSEKFWRVSPEDMTYEWTDERVPRARPLEVIKGAFCDRQTDLGPNPEFQYPSKLGAGFAAIGQAMASKIENIHYGMRATSIEPYKKVISFNDGEEKINYDHLITTLPLPELIKLLPDVPSDIQEAINKLCFNSIAIVNLGINQPQVSNWHWAHFPEEDISFFRISFPSNFCEGLAPANTSSIQAEISYDGANKPEKDALLKQVHDDLLKVGVLEQKHQLIFQDVIYKHYGYVVYRYDRKEAVDKIHRYLNSLDMYPCGRYGAWEYLWMDEAILSGKITAQKLLQKLQAAKF